LSKKEKCACGKHKSKHHGEMTQPELIAHVKECLEGAIDRLECIKEVMDRITTE
jgi:hypothetical protein